MREVREKRKGWMEKSDGRNEGRGGSKIRSKGRKERR